MKIKIFVACIALLSSLFTLTSPAFAYVRVKGFYKSNGTYVRPYARSVPNSLKYDNYSFSGGNLYNKSYSSLKYKQSWYKPSYTTDKSYYTGKSLYNSYKLK